MERVVGARIAVAIERRRCRRARLDLLPQTVVRTAKASGPMLQSPDCHGTLAWLRVLPEQPLLPRRARTQVENH